MKYDAIVIGSSNGGLVSALTLQKAHKKVLLLEANSFPGEYTTSFVRGRFEFDVSFNELLCFGTESSHGELYELFERLNLLKHMNFCKGPQNYVIYLSDTDETFELPFSVSDFILKMEEYVPDSKESMHDFFELAREVLDGLSYIVHSKEEFDETFLKQNYPNFMKVSAYSVDEVMKHLHMPKKAQDILCAYWVSFGSPTSTLSFVSFASAFYSFIKYGIWSSSSKSSSIASSLIDEFEQSGGEVQYLSRVVEIMMSENQVIGVRCDDGRKYQASYIVSNVSPTTFYGTLLPASFRDERMNRLCNSRTLGAQGLSIYLGLNCSVEDLGLNHYRYFLFHSFDRHKEYLHMKEMYHTTCQAVVLNLANPHCSPKGTTIIQISSFYPEEIFSKYVNEENYFEVKSKIADTFISALEQATHVSIRDAIEEIEVATPVTFARYGGHPNGSIFGYMAKGYDNFLPRVMNAKNENIFSNVRFCGIFGSHIASCNDSYFDGEEVALEILKEMKGDLTHEY